MLAAGLVMKILMGLCIHLHTSFCLAGGYFEVGKEDVVQWEMPAYIWRCNVECKRTTNHVLVDALLGLDWIGL